MRAWAASLAALSLLGGAALAQPPGSTPARLDAINKTYDRCMNKAITNPQFSACGAARLKADDLLLNDAWRRVYGQTRGPGKPALLAEQRLWIAYKDKSCAAWLADRGREGQVIHYPLCRSTVIEERIRMLELLS